MHPYTVSVPRSDKIDDTPYELPTEYVEHVRVSRTVIVRGGATAGQLKRFRDKGAIDIRHYSDGN